MVGGSGLPSKHWVTWLAWLNPMDTDSKHWNALNSSPMIAVFPKILHLPRQKNARVFPTNFPPNLPGRFQVKLPYKKYKNPQLSRWHPSAPGPLWLPPLWPSSREARRRLRRCAASTWKPSKVRWVGWEWGARVGKNVENVDWFNWSMGDFSELSIFPWGFDGDFMGIWLMKVYSSIKHGELHIKIQESGGKMHQLGGFTCGFSDDFVKLVGCKNHQATSGLRTYFI